MIRKLLITFIFSICMLFPHFASAAECTLYEQSHPAFLLDGAHLSTGKCSTCATCHRGGVFMGTPRTCIACHNGDPARVTVSRSSAHIPTLLVDCNSCHKTTLFTTNTNMNHNAMAASRCDSCHITLYASYGSRAKPKDHVPTTADCRTCHNTNNWDVNHAALHAGIVTGCVSCHDNQTAVGKASYAAHPVTSDNCETCHSINAEFKCASVLDKLINFAQLTYQRIFA